MSKTLTAEEFYNKWFYKNQEIYVNTKFKELMPMFAEAYHKAKVIESVEHINILKEKDGEFEDACNNAKDLETAKYYQGKRVAYTNVLQKLLNQ